MEVKVNYELERIEKNKVNECCEEVTTHNPVNLTLKDYDYALVSEKVGNNLSKIRVVLKNEPENSVLVAKDLDELLRYAILGRGMYETWMRNAEGIDIAILNCWKDGERSLKESDVNYFNWKTLMPERD